MAARDVPPSWQPFLPGSQVARVIAHARAQGKERFALLARSGIAAVAKPDAPGVYVAGAKIASLGLRIRRGCSFHGLALNVNLDLTDRKSVV